MQKIVIVGGGTSGWLTALMVQRAYPKGHITLVESEEIGILGAGEGTVPYFVNKLDFLGIPVSDLVQRAEATVKNGIKFTNWNGDNDYYYHNFSPSSRQSLGEFDSPFSKYNVSYLFNSYTKTPSDETEVFSMLNKDNKVPFTKKATSFVDSNPIFDFTNFGNFALHFNAVKLAAVLREYAEMRGVIRVEGKVNTIKSKENGDISSLVLESGEEINSDFVFDCSGFRRLVIGGHYKAEWVDYSSKLSVDTAIPFFVDYKENEVTPPYTEAIAMKYGWVWKIPVESRYGCGYVFDSNLVSEEDALKEAEDLFDQKLTSPKTFKFKAGYYKTPWINNCISIGLSGGFVEPLEATSIWASLMYLEEVLHTPSNLFRKNSAVMYEFNKTCEQINEEISNFLYLHYMGSRTDTQFWTKYSNLDTAPEQIQLLITKWDAVLPLYSDVSDSLFDYHGWFSVAAGVKKVNELVIKDVIESNIYLHSLSSFYTSKNKQKTLTEHSINHDVFLNHLKNNLY